MPRFVGRVAGLRRAMLAAFWRLSRGRRRHRERKNSRLQSWVNVVVTTVVTRNFEQMPEPLQQ